MSRPAKALPSQNNQAPNHAQGHRARLRQRFLKGGANALADYELLEMVLFMAIPRADTKPLAKNLLARFKTFSGVIAADAKDLATVKGVGETCIAALKIIETSAIKLKHDQIVKKPVINSWMGILDYVESSLKYKKAEEFRVLFLDKKNQLIADELQQQGTVDQAVVYPREIIKRALELHASALILVHNHPSGDTTPSSQDIQLTQHIKDTAQKLDVKLHDHVIVAGDSYTSFKSLGLL